METQIEQLLAENRFGTARNYEKAKRSFAAFLGNVKLSLSCLTEQKILEYNVFLVQKGLVRNSVSFYMRVLRAVYNKAANQKLIRNASPFAEVYTGIDKTRKRAVPTSVITQLIRLELPEYSQLAFARDLFVFSYCARGMAFVDMAYLRKKDCREGAISYSRRKTGQLLCVRIEPPIQRIIEKYASEGSPYVFPIISSTDASEAYMQYQIALNVYNRSLGVLSKMLNCDCKLTSYTSRHSWATAARNRNIPISVISQGMGHSSEQTTQIYLAMIENSVIDEANKLIIEDLG